MISFLRRLRYFINESNLKLIYSSVILPHFDYADTVWQSASKIHLDQLQKLQNRAGRIILQVKPYEHKSIYQIHDNLKWESLKCRRRRHMYSLLFKSFHELTPEYITQNFVWKENCYGLRSNDTLMLPKPKTNQCKRTFLYRGSVLYNALPLHLRQLGTLSLFNKQVQEYFNDFEL